MKKQINDAISVITQKSLEAQLQRIERKLDQLNNPKPKWVKSTVIIELTGWNKDRMASARNNNELTWKKDSTGFWYDLNSLHPYLVKVKC